MSKFSVGDKVVWTNKGYASSFGLDPNQVMTIKSVDERSDLVSVEEHDVGMFDHHIKLAISVSSETALSIQYGGNHYKGKGIQPIEYILANNLGFCEGNVVKYITRWKDKGGIEDLKKIKHYCDFLIENEDI